MIETFLIHNVLIKINEILLVLYLCNECADSFLTSTGTLMDVLTCLNNTVNQFFAYEIYSVINYKIKTVIEYNFVFNIKKVLLLRLTKFDAHV